MSLGSSGRHPPAQQSAPAPSPLRRLRARVESSTAPCRDTYATTPAAARPLASPELAQQSALQRALPSNRRGEGLQRVLRDAATKTAAPAHEQPCQVPVFFRDCLGDVHGQEPASFQRASRRARSRRTPIVGQSPCKEAPSLALPRCRNWQRRREANRTLTRPPILIIDTRWNVPPLLPLPATGEGEGGGFPPQRRGRRQEHDAEAPTAPTDSV